MNITIIQENELNFDFDGDGNGGIEFWVINDKDEEFIIGGINNTGKVWLDLEAIEDAGLISEY